MSLRLKTKLSFGLIFLFVVILLFGILGIANINRLGKDADQVLRNNYESLVYCNGMLKALDNIKIKRDAAEVFEENLKKQELNITEMGEREITAELRKDFEELKANPSDSSNYPQIRASITQIQDLNQMAMFRKNSTAQKTAENAKLWLTVVFTILTLIAFTFIFNLPGVISGPIRGLSEGIAEIAGKNYKKRIYLKQKDEFGDLANAFNDMAAKLDEYEHSNLSQIKFEKSRIETIINQMKDAIIGFDQQRNILFLNALAEKLLGLKEKDIIGSYAPDIALKNDLMRTILQNEQDKKELKIYADGKESYFGRDILDVTNNNEVIGHVIVLRNITAYQEMNKAKTDFIATLSHEIRTPVSSIRTKAQQLRDKTVNTLKDGDSELLHSIVDDAERLFRITGDLLSMAQVETDDIQLNIQPAVPLLIIEKALHAVQIQADQKHIELRLEIEPSLPAIRMDAEKTERVLNNFLTNAIKASAEQTVITVSVLKKEKNLLFTVRDHGRGIDEKYLPRIFDRYFKVPGTHDRSGTGLGLAISKKYIEAQGGRIWAESEVGEGSVFGFSFLYQ